MLERRRHLHRLRPGRGSLITAKIFLGPPNPASCRAWFYDQPADGDVYIGWCLRVDTREEPEAVGARRGTEILGTGIRKRTDGTMTSPSRTPDTVYCWQRGLPNVFHVPDMATHAARRPCEQPAAPRGITWTEVGGTQQDMVHWLGDEAKNLPLNYNGERPGLYAVAIDTPRGRS